MQATTKDDRTMAMLCHLLALAGLVVPFGNVLGPLVLWMVKKDQSWFIDDQGKESVNFQISLTIYIIVASILMFILIGFLLLPVIGIGGLVLTIMAALKANEGVTYRYPLTLRFIK